MEGSRDSEVEVEVGGGVDEEPKFLWLGMRHDLIGKLIIPLWLSFPACSFLSAGQYWGNWIRHDTTRRVTTQWPSSDIRPVEDVRRRT